MNPTSQQPFRPFQPTLTQSGLRRFGLDMRAYKPTKMFNGTVHSYLQIHAQCPTPYPVIPDATQAIFMGPDAVMIGGAQQQAFNIPLMQPGMYFGIWFQPGGLRHFLRHSVSEISGHFVDKSFLPPGISDLHEKIYSTGLFKQQIQYCEQWLSMVFRPVRANRFEQALATIYQSMGDIRVADLANRVGWSSRHLSRMFQCYTGLSTKAFTQTIRLQHACRHIFCHSSDSLLTAYELGFFDQSHFIRDAKKRLLDNPHRFLSDFSY